MLSCSDEILSCYNNLIMSFERDDKLCKQDIKSFEQHIKSSEQVKKIKLACPFPGSVLWTAMLTLRMVTLPLLNFSRHVSVIAS